MRNNYNDFWESIDFGIETVIVDNTNISHGEYDKYKRYAENRGYIVSFVTMPMVSPEVAAERNKHGWPEEDIKRMMKRWNKM